MDIAASSRESDAGTKAGQDMTKDILRQVVIPALEKEVNEGANFAALRQIYHALVLAGWYKREIKNSLLSAVYVGRQKTDGIKIDDPRMAENIWGQYVEAFKKGAYNLIREERDSVSDELIPRKYFAGGVVVGGPALNEAMSFVPKNAEAIESEADFSQDHFSTVSVQLSGSDETAVKAIEVPVVSEIEPLLKGVESGSFNALAWTGNVDALDARLREHARSLNRDYLRLTLRDESDLARLMTCVIVRDGEMTRIKGPLPLIIEKGGVLFIDYTNSDPKLVEQFNSLFDSQPYYKDSVVAPSLTIIGGINDRQVKDFPGSFYSRFGNAKGMTGSGMVSVDLPFRDPLTGIREFEEGVVGEEIDIFESTDLHKIRNALVGRYLIDDHGGIKAIAGGLIRAIKAGRALILRGGNWQDKSLPQILRQILLEKQVDFNGETVTIPDDFVIYRKDGTFGSGIVGKTLVMPEESIQAGDVWVINSQTQDILSGIKFVTPDGLLAVHDSLLEQKGASLKLLVTGPLDVSAWHRIMHASANIEVQVMPGVSVPSVYQSFRSSGLMAGNMKAHEEKWDVVKGQKTFILEGDDQELALDKIEQEFGKENVDVVPLTAETSLQQLIEGYQFTASEDGLGDRRVGLAPREMIRRLREGRTVVLAGGHTNTALLKSMEGAWQAHPYLIENGVRISLDDLPGRLVVLMKPQVQPAVQAAHRARLSFSDQETGSVLAREFSGKFKEEIFIKLMDLRKTFQDNIPSSVPAGLYPSKVEFGLARMRLLYHYLEQDGSNWIHAFEQVIIPAYVNDPEVVAYMRALVRLTFNEDYKGRQPNTIHGGQLSQALNAVKPGEWEKHWDGSFWRLADTLSLDLLKSAGLDIKFSKRSQKNIYQLIQMALIRSSRGQREVYNRDRFHMRGDVQSAPIIDDKLVLPTTTEQWEQQIRSSVEALNVGNGVMLKGSPGAGKSYSTEKIAEALGYVKDEIMDAVTVGADSHETDVVMRQTTKNGTTQEAPGAVARWAAMPHGGVLIIDEANLPREEGFWNFLEGVFSARPHVWINGKKIPLTSRHKIILTGNQETLAGRQFMELIEKHMVTVPFQSFDKGFLKGLVTGYVGPDNADREKLVDLMVDLHFLFQRMIPQTDLSLRDLQELAARVNIVLGSHWTPEAVIHLAWDLYKGNFDTTERMAMEFVLNEEYGVLVHEMDQEKIELIKQHESRDHVYAAEGIVLNSSTAEANGSLEDALDMREARLSGQTSIQGKRGEIVEGSSARGKVVIVLATLKARGFVEASYKEVLDEKKGGVIAPAPKKFYRLTASLDADLFIKVIDRARKEGAVVVISEMNLLDSGFLEGQLNDVLTGNAQPGFFLVATINSVDFQGREKLSSALQNRIVYKKLNDYTPEDLREIVAAKAGAGVSAEDIDLIVNAHLWLGEQITDKELHPTTRDLLRVNKVMSGTKKNVEEALDEVYGPLYLKKILKGRTFPARQELLKYQPNVQEKKKEKFRMMSKLASFIVPRAYGDIEIMEDPSGGSAGGFWSRANKAITIASSSFLNGAWFEVLIHEIGHACFTRDIPYLSTELYNGVLEPVIQDLEDLRQLAARKFHAPHSVSARPSVALQRFARMVAQQDVDAFVAWRTQSKDPLTLKKMFQYALWIYADHGITSEDMLQKRSDQLKEFANLLEGFFDVNPVGLALEHLDKARQVGEAIPKTWDEEEISFQQYRALRMVQTMEKSFSQIPDEQKPEEALSSEAQEKNMARTAGTLAHIDHPDKLPQAERGVETGGGHKSLDEMKKELRQKMASPSSGHGYRKRLLQIFGWDVAGAVGGAEGLRHGAHNARSGSAKVEKSVRIVSQKPKSVRADLSINETSSGNKRMAQASKAGRKEILQALDVFWEQKHVADKVYGLDGELDLERYLNDPSRGFAKSGGDVDKKKKDVVVSFSQKVVWNPVLEEAFMFLFQEGFKVTVYTGQESFVEGIQTLGDLKRIADGIEGVPEDKIRNDLMERKQRGTYEVVSITDIQRMVEEGYAYWLAHAAITGKEITSEAAPAAAENKAPVLTFEEQVKEAKAFLLKNNIYEGVLVIKEDGESMILNLASAKGKIKDIAFLAGWTSLKYLNLTGLSIEDLSPLAGLVNLQDLILKDIPVTDLSPLAGLVNLERLFLERTPVIDLSPLAGLKNLQYLNLGETSVNEASLLPLIGLPSLSILDVSDTDIARFEDEHRFDDPAILSSKPLLNFFVQQSNFEKLDIAANLRNDSNALGYIFRESLRQGYSDRVKKLKEAQQPVIGSALSIDEQVKKLKTFFSEKGVKFVDIVVKGSTSGITLSLEGTKVTIQDILLLDGVTDVTVLWLGDANIKELSSLVGFKQLRNVIFSEKPGFKEVDAYDLLIKHPKREELAINFGFSEAITWATVPEEYKKRSVVSGVDQKSSVEYRVFHELLDRHGVIHRLHQRFAVDGLGDKFDAFLKSVDMSELTPGKSALNLRGGIDLTLDKTIIRSQGPAVTLGGSLSRQFLNAMHVKGYVPVILSIAPTDFLHFLKN